MPDPEYPLRPQIETFDHAGCRVTLIDAAGILDAARVERVELRPDPAFPAPVRRVRFAVSGSVFEAEVATGPAGAAEGLGPGVLGMTGPVGVLLARRVAAGDPLATKIADGIGVAAAEAYRRLGLDRPAGGGAASGPAASGAAAGGATAGSATAPSADTPAVREVDGLRITVSQTEGSPPGGRTTTLRATVPAETAAPDHLRALVRAVLDTVVELVRGSGADPEAEPLAGRAYVLRRPAPSGGSDSTEHVTLDQVGGLADVVAQFRQIAVSFRHPDAMARWGARRPQGILMYGPPGTGKTMLARALANEIGANFREIRTPEILDKWLGASERNIKAIFREARRYREPTVMLFDEFDSIISYAGSGGDAASQAVNAVAGIFKQEMNTLIEENPNVIVVATTNFPHRVDESLTRSGRFDVKIAIPLPDESGRAEIVAKMVRQLIARHEVPGFRMFADDLDPRDLARASVGMTGADLKEVLRRAQLSKAMQEARTGTVPTPISQAELRQCIAGLRAGRAA